MTQKDAMAIALKFYAIYLLSQLITGIPVLVTLGLHFKNWTGTELNSLLAVSVPVMSVLFGIGAAGLVWKCSNSLLKESPSEVPDPAAPGVDLVMKTVFACMGVYFAIAGVVMMPQSLVNFQIARELSQSQVRLPAMNLLSKVLEILFGVLLVAMPYKWVRFIKGLWNE